jgi:hypothetical protein
VSIDENLNIGTSQQLLAALSGNVFKWTQYLPGFPTIFNGEVVFPFLNPGDETLAGDNVLVVFRAALAVNPVFTSEIVDGPLGPSQAIGSYGSDKLSCSALLVIDGLLYCFYFADNNQGFMGSSDSVSFLYYSTNMGPGQGWSARTLVYTSPTPAEPLTPYPVQVSGTTFGLLFSLIDPTLFFDGLTKYSSLSNFFLSIGGATAPPPPKAFYRPSTAYPRFCPEVVPKKKVNWSEFQPAVDRARPRNLEETRGSCADPRLRGK